ncbi:hypothetical protein JCM11251_007294 [Rhodosporidiobolus azoricus]
MADSSGQWKESISLEETNKIRVSLGLKPIADPNASSSGEAKPALDGDALAEDNYAKRREAEMREKDAQALKDRIDKARNQKDRVKKLVGRGLGDADEDEAMREKVKQEMEGDDTKSWVKKQKKRAKELAEKRAKEQEEADRLAEEEEKERASKYGEEDLKGLKVAHGADAFEDGEEAVLTLKDSRILDDEDDELHNVNLTENARHKHALELKKKGRQAGQYTGYDDEEFEGGAGSSRGVLSKYDEGFEGMKVEGFSLGSAPVPTKGKGKAAAGGAEVEEEGEREKVKLSLDYTKNFNSDYLQEGDVGFKKPKKKKKRPARTTTLADEPDADSSAMDVEGASSAPKQIERVSLDETNLIDDEDLAVSLARQRRDAAKQKIKSLKARAAATPAPPAVSGNGMDVEDDVTVKQEDDEDATTSLPRAAKPTEEEDDEGDVLILDDTSEFVRNISLAATAAQERAEREAERAARQQSASAAAAQQRTPAAGVASVLPQIKREEDIPLDEIAGGGSGWGEAREDGEEDEAMYDPDAIANGAAEAEDVKPIKPEDDEDGLATTGQEQLVSRGLASTLSMLRHQGLVKTRTKEELAKEKELKEREAWLADQRKRQMEREREKLESRRAGDQKGQQQREYENRVREQRDAQATLEAYSNYKPVVNLTYHDEFGRDMTPKEAWKHLSHAFHGHGSGSKKTEKRLKKIENERKAAAMAAGDTPLSSAAAFAARAEKTGSATMILGVGNNNSAPIQEDALGNVSKLDKSLKGKGKPIVAPPPTSRNNRAGSASASAAGIQAVINDIPMRPLRLPPTTSVSGGAREVTGTPEPSGSGAGGMRRAGFAPVRSFSPAVTAASASPEPSGEGGGKFAIAVKRKAAGEGEGSPASKRRA